MGAGLLGYLMGSIGITWVVATIWRYMMWPIRPIRRSPHLSYGLSIGIAGLLVFVNPEPVAILGVVIGLAIVFWQYRRAVAKAL